MIEPIEYDWVAFRALVREYETLLDSTGSMNRESFEIAVFGVLSRLFAAGVSMWTLNKASEDSQDDDEPDGDDEWDPSQEPTTDELNAESDASNDVKWRYREALEELLGDHTRYRATFDPYEAGMLWGDLADDLADILHDLRDGAAKYDEGKVLEASWTWPCHFWHTGLHAIGAMQALHRVVVHDSEVGEYDAESDTADE